MPALSTFTTRRQYRPNAFTRRLLWPGRGGVMAGSVWRSIKKQPQV